MLLKDVETSQASIPEKNSYTGTDNEDRCVL